MAHSIRHNSFQNEDANWGPRSETISLGVLWSLKTWSWTACAVSLAEGCFGSGMKCVILLKQSTMVRMAVFPSEAGSPVTKSMAIWDQGQVGTGRGWRRSAGGCLEDLFRAQVWQAWTYPRASFSKDGHQKLWVIRRQVRVAPGWHVPIEEPGTRGILA